MLQEASGIVSNIQKFSVQDGPGIRTTVFLKGCPLRCLWCHNPEGLEPGPEIAYRAGRCIGCGQCEGACPQHIGIISELQRAVEMLENA